ncbi:MAG: hypothetical protein ACJ0BD_00585 [Gammaproteobacteria bacterium]|tara:strand:- start:365 stop:553 length:189 start_codon:yes stop_codon:yes gene_type:complete
MKWFFGWALISYINYQIVKYFYTNEVKKEIPKNERSGIAMGCVAVAGIILYVIMGATGNIYQ